jgi:CheY-like chemotaxis protein
MDIQMPHMFGFEATRVIRGQEKGRGGHIPIVAITGHANLIDQQRCLDADMDSYLANPFNFQNLFAVVGASLNITVSE